MDQDVLRHGFAFPNAEMFENCKMLFYKSKFPGKLQSECQKIGVCGRYLVFVQGLHVS